MLVVRRARTTLVLTLFLLGCAQSGQASNFDPCARRAIGLLLPDGRGTAISVMPTSIDGPAGPINPVVWPSGYNDGRSIVSVTWPSGFTHLRLAGGEVAVLDPHGNVVATTGRRYSLKGAWIIGAPFGFRESPEPLQVTGFVACGAIPLRPL